MKTLTYEAWLARAVELYGEDPRAWRFRCVACGHVQSGREVRERNPHLQRVETWIFFSCEGRWNPAVGCDWTLGGLLHLHRLEVEVGDPDEPNQPVFEFADDPLDGWTPSRAPREGGG